MLSLNNYLLEKIAAAINDYSYVMEWYLDVQKEEVTFLGDPVVTGEYETDEKLKKLIENDEDEERFIAIPPRPPHEGWQQMESFILVQDQLDENVRNLLMRTIQGKRAFRHFKDAMYDADLVDQWHEFKGREDRKETLNWLYRCNLITEDDIEAGMQLHEEKVKKRKQRNEQIAAMKKDVQIKCCNNYGHEDKLTIGNTYEALDEQKQHQNLRIKDDRGKVVWLGKALFELR